MISTIVIENHCTLFISFVYLIGKFTLRFINTSHNDGACIVLLETLVLLGIFDLVCTCSRTSN